MSEEVENVKEEVMFLIDLALRTNNLDEKNKILEQIKDLTKNNLKNM